MKVKKDKNSKEKIPRYSEISAPKTQILIDEEFKDIINRHCPGRLYKLMKQRVKYKSQSQSIIESKLNIQRQMKIFQTVFLREKKKTAQKEKKKQGILLQIQQRIQRGQKQPQPFFELSRDSIIRLQRKSLPIDNYNQKSKLKLDKKKKIEQIHPYIRIAAHTSSNVWLEICQKQKRKKETIIQFSPFGEVEPLQILQ